MALLSNIKNKFDSLSQQYKNNPLKTLTKAGVKGAETMLNRMIPTNVAPQVKNNQSIIRNVLPSKKISSVSPAPQQNQSIPNQSLNTAPPTPLVTATQPMQQPPTQAVPSQLSIASSRPTVSSREELLSNNQAKINALKQLESGTNTAQVAGNQMVEDKKPEIFETPVQKNNLSDAQSKYLALLQPSSEEESLVSRFNELASKQEQLGVSEAAGLNQIEDETVPMQFITGKQSSLQRQAAVKQQALAAQAKPLLDRLAQLQLNRQSQAEMIKTQLGFESEAQKANAPTFQEIGGNLLRISPTGEIETVYQAPSEATKPVTLSTGQVLVDPSTGSILATGRENPQEQLQLQKLQLDIQKAQQDLSGSGQMLSPTMLQDAVNKGYTSPEQLKLYAQFAYSGAEAPMLKEPSQSQYTAAGFANRASQAGTIIDSIGTQFASAFARGGLLPNFMKTDDRQMFEQAQRNFINAVLRRESGAVISPEEFNNAALQYFPQPGDSQAVLSQKRQNRSSVIGNLSAEAGRALQQQTNQNPFTTGAVIDPFGFNKVGSDTNLGALKQSIIQQESGGNYKAVGVPTNAGRALGKYQIMPKYHFKKIGLSDTPADHQKFLNSPQLQDTLFERIIDDLARQYNNDPRKIAAAYYGGGGGVQKLGTPAGDARYQGGISPSINQYVTQVMSRIYG